MLCDLRILAVTLTLASCPACDSNTTTSGNTPGGDSSPATDGSMTALCDAQCSRDEACPDPTITHAADYDCRAICRNKVGTNSAFRAVSINAMTDCYRSLACNQSDDQCMEAAILAVTAVPENFPGVESCLTRHNACASNAAGGFSDDLCYELIILTPTAASAFEGCLSGACESVHSCFDGIIGQKQ